MINVRRCSHYYTEFPTALTTKALTRSVRLLLKLRVNPTNMLLLSTGDGKGGACCSKRGWLYESSSEVGGALLVNSRVDETSPKSTVDVISAQGKAHFFFVQEEGEEEAKTNELQPAWRCSLGAPRVAASPPPLLSFYFYVFQRHIPAGCRNVATECFKNSILSSDSAAPVAPRHCGARSRNAKMATDLGELLVPYMPTIRVPRTGDRVFKSECAFSFDSPVSVSSASPPLRTNALRLARTHTYRNPVRHERAVGGEGAGGMCVASGADRNAREPRRLCACLRVSQWPRSSRGNK